MVRFVFTGKKTTLLWAMLAFPVLSASARDLRTLTLDLPEPNSAETQVEAEVLPALSWPNYFSKHPELSRVHFGVSLQGGQALQLNAQETMTPASIEKIVTAATAIKLLGSHYQFQNTFTGSTLASGVLVNPHFQVSGDPTWGHPSYENSSARIAKVIEALRARGVTQVQGPVMIDETRAELSQIPRSSGWKEAWYSDCMAVQQTPFQFNGNCGTLLIQSSKIARWTTKGVDVPLKLSLNRARKNRIQITPNFDSVGKIESYSVSGSVASSVSYDLPVHTGSRWLQNLFKSELKAAGISYTEVLTIERSTSTEISVDLSSEPLLDILKTAVSKSINGIMDRVFYEIAISAQASDVAGPEKELIQNLAGDDALLQGIEVYDGSGLDTRNRMRPDTLYAVLKNVRMDVTPLTRTNYFQDFVSTLAVSGKSGTLVSRLSGSETIGRVFAKTGTLDGINNLAGYFLTNAGAYEPFVFLTRSKLSSSQVRSMTDSLVLNFARQN